jgi:CxxC motif-containing protein (DUF1111 family)
MRVLPILATFFAGLLALSLFESTSRAGSDAEVTGPLGGPIPGLNAGQLATFEFGRSIFTKRFTRAEGLGPHFNASSCASCHEDPVTGGSSQRYRDFFLAGRTRPDGTVAKIYPDCTEENRDTQRSECCLPSLVIPHYGPKGSIDRPVAAGVEHPKILPDADVVARRNAPPLFGVGLFRLITDAEILSRADPDDADGDGISGRVNHVATEEGRIGRFGYKCQTVSIEAFNRGAFNNQMGITSDSTELAMGGERAGTEADTGRGFLDELLGAKTAYAQVANPVDRIIDFDEVRDPEVTRGELLALVFFQENLAAPRRGRITASVLAGEQIFARVGCDRCHVPSLDTPLGEIHPYTDLLIHDMGPGLADGVVMFAAGGSEFRTQPLWGLCHHAPFLHDGRADTVREAILAHGGEAQAARDAYAGLSEGERRLLHRFLESL